MLYVSIIIFSALLYTYYHFRDRVPILMYHRIASVPGDRNALPVEKFEEQMRYLEENGFHSITMEELQAHFLHGKRLPKKPVVLTFDDGYEDNFSAALPILKNTAMWEMYFPLPIGSAGRTNGKISEKRRRGQWMNVNWPCGRMRGIMSVPIPWITRF